VVLLPPDLVGDGGRIMARGQPGGLRGVRGCAAGMGRHVGHAGRLTCGPRRGNGSWVADIPSRCVRPGGQGTDRSDLDLATSEGSEALDGITRAFVARGLHLE
jgi:hypothetical protein